MREGRGTDVENSTTTMVDQNPRSPCGHANYGRMTGISIEHR